MNAKSKSKTRSKSDSKPKKNRLSTRAMREALFSFDGLVADIATSFNLPYEKVYSYLNKNPELCKLREIVLEKKLDLAEKRLFEAVDAGNQWAIKYLLDKQGADRGYGENPDNVSKVIIDVKPSDALDLEDI